MDSGSDAPMPVAIIGGGPIGLAAAAHLIARGERPLVLEAGRSVGANVRAWSHVRLFTPWRYLTDPVAVRLLEASGWPAPEPDHLPLGSEFVDRYIEPLAALPQISSHVLTDRRVTAVSRVAMDRYGAPGRRHAPFELVVDRNDGRTERYRSRAVLDASGTYNTPNPVGANGTSARRELDFREAIRYGVPDIGGKLRSRYSGKRVLVVGSGHSAFHAVTELVQVARTAPSTEVAWAVRRAEVGAMFGDLQADALPARGSLAAGVRAHVERGEVSLVMGFRVAALDQEPGGIFVRDEGGEVIGPVDEIVAATGFRPDLGMLREIRLGLDAVLEAPVRLAPLIDPLRHTCGTVRPHGYEELIHPEPDFFLVGMKSYGRASSFLLHTGYEQVRSVVAALTGDMEGALNLVPAILGAAACCQAPRIPVSLARDSSRTDG